MKSLDRLVTISTFLFYLCNILILSVLIIFTISYSFDQKEIISSKLIIIIMLLSLILKLIYWQLIKSKIISYKKIERANFLKLVFIILTVALPLYMIVQEPSLIVNELIGKISFILVLAFAIFGVYLERYLFIVQTKIFLNIHSKEKKI